MKVLAFNGSPRANSNTGYALETAAKPLRGRGIEVEIIQVGNKALRGCIACGKCRKTQNMQCAIDDELNSILLKAKDIDGIIIGSPVHYAGIGGTMKSFLDRFFYVCSANGNILRHKVGASVCSVRRSGGVVTYDCLNHFLTISEMVVASGNYWPAIHGTAPGESDQDAEGVQTLSVLGENMAWLLELIENGKGRVEEPAQQAKEMMNFIR